MRILSTFIFVFSILVGSANANKCCENSSDSPCVKEISAHFDRVTLWNPDGRFNFQIKGTMEEYRMSCNLVNQCLTKCSKASCLQNNGKGEMRLATTMIKSLCHLTTVEGENCFQKLATRNSECIKNFHPYLNQYQLNNENAKEEFCNNYFGEKTCMKKEVTAACGRYGWVYFRDFHSIALTSLWRACDWTEIVSSLDKEEKKMIKIRRIV